MNSSLIIEEKRLIIDDLSDSDDETINSKSYQADFSFNEAIDFNVDKIVGYELINKKKGNQILSNINLVKTKLRPKCLMNQKKYDPIQHFRNYMKTYKSNSFSHIKIIYNHSINSPQGRLFANSVSLQSLPREIRGSLTSDIYNDYDFKNCHPTILLHLCNKYKLKTKYLKFYLKERKYILNLISKECSITKEEAKLTILKLINNGFKYYNNLNNKPKILKKIKNEITDNIKLLVKNDKYNYLYEKRKKIKVDNIIGSVINCIYCQKESKMLNIVYNYVISKYGFEGVKNAILCFDGLMLLKKYILDSNDLKNIRILIFLKLDIDIFLINKHMEQLEINFEDLEVDFQNMNEYLNNDIYWLDFHKLLTEDIFSDINNLEEFITNNINKVLFTTIGNNNYIVKLDKDDIYCVAKSIPTCIVQYWKPKPTGIQVKKSIKLSTLVDNSFKISNCLNRYNRLTFVPINEFTPKALYPSNNDFNTWSKFNADLIPKNEINMNLINPILSAIYEIWSNSNEERYKYILSWFHKIFTRPFEKNKVVLVLYSPEKQIGKGIIINEFLIKYVFGKLYSMAVNSLDTLTCRFNKILMNKLFICCDELSSVDGINFNSMFDVLKNRITEPTIKIEIKGGKSFIYPDYSSYIFCTNHNYTIKLEEGDVRYSVFKCSPQHKGDYNYYNHLITYFNEESANHFFSYIYYLDNPVEIRNTIYTPIKSQMIFNSLSSPKRFLHFIFKEYRNYIDNIDNIDNTNQHNEGKEYWIETFINYIYNTHYIKRSSLYIVYKEYCVNYNEKLLSKIKFNRMITEKYDYIVYNGIYCLNLNHLNSVYNF